ncbi:hypothetical protein V8C86DRAFT_1161192 [Haematococcus lacustris]
MHTLPLPPGRLLTGDWLSTKHLGDQAFVSALVSQLALWPRPLLHKPRRHTSMAASRAVWQAGRTQPRRRAWDTHHAHAVAAGAAAALGASVEPPAFLPDCPGQPGARGSDRRPGVRVGVRVGPGCVADSCAAPPPHHPASFSSSSSPHRTSPLAYSFTCCPAGQNGTHSFRLAPSGALCPGLPRLELPARLAGCCHVKGVVRLISG